MHSTGSTVTSRISASAYVPVEGTDIRRDVLAPGRRRARCVAVSLSATYQGAAGGGSGASPQPETCRWTQGVERGDRDERRDRAAVRFSMGPGSVRSDGSGNSWNGRSPDESKCRGVRLVVDRNPAACASFRTRLAQLSIGNRGGLSGLLRASREERALIWPLSAALRSASRAACALAER